MIVSASAPSRLGIIGGGTDIKPYSEIYGGMTISLAINIKSRVTIYTEDDLFHHPYTEVPQGISPNFFYTIMKELGFGSMHHISARSRFEGIIGAGLGSSASSAVALIGAIYKAKASKASKGKNINLTNLPEIAELAHYIETVKMGWHGGRQDQYTAVYGGLNLFHFKKNVTVSPYVRYTADELASYLTLFYIGGTRISAKIQKNFEKLTTEQISILNELKDVVLLVDFALKRSSMENVGKFLHKAWELKKASNKGVTDARIDGIYDFGRKEGAMSGKLCGAGQSGYFIFFVSPERRANLINKMREKGFEEVDFEPDNQGLSTRIL